MRHKIPFRRPYPQWQRDPPNQAVLWVSCASRPRQFLSLLNTHCPSLGYITAQPGKGAPLRLAPAFWELSRGRHRNPPQGCSELDLVGAGSVHFMVSEQRRNCLCWAEWLPREFQVPLCKLIPLPLAVEWTPLWLSSAPVLSNVPHPPPPTHMASSTEIHQEQSLELEPKPVVARGSWRCKVVRNGSHFFVSPSPLIGASPGCGRSEWRKGGIWTQASRLSQLLGVVPPPTI